MKMLFDLLNISPYTPVLSACSLENSDAFLTVIKCELLSLGRFLKIIDILTLELGPNSSISGRSSVPERMYKMSSTLRKSFRRNS